MLFKLNKCVCWCVTNIFRSLILVTSVGSKWQEFLFFLFCQCCFSSHWRTTEYFLDMTTLHYILTVILLIPQGLHPVQGKLEHNNQADTRNHGIHPIPGRVSLPAFSPQILIKRVWGITMKNIRGAGEDFPAVGVTLSTWKVNINNWMKWKI